LGILDTVHRRLREPDYVRSNSGRQEHSFPAPEKI
jgi:hypothetical protein